MKIWEWFVAAGIGLILLYSLLKSKSSSTVIIDGSTGSSSQGSLNKVIDSISFGSLTSLFGSSSGSSTSSLASGNAPLSAFDNSQSVETGGAVPVVYGPPVDSSTLNDQLAAQFNASGGANIDPAAGYSDDAPF